MKAGEAEDLSDEHLPLETFPDKCDSTLESKEEAIQEADKNSGASSMTSLSGLQTVDSNPLGHLIKKRLCASGDMSESDTTIPVSILRRPISALFDFDSPCQDHNLVTGFELTYTSPGQSFSIKRKFGQPSGQAKKHKSRACLSVIKVHQSRWEKKLLQVATTEMLPHILFPVGHKQTGQSMKTLPTIRALLDTGSGLNIGYEPYWKSVYQNHPEIVREFGKMSENEEEKLTIGGIDRHGEGTSCTHYIVLKTPFLDRGREVDLRIALTDGLSCNLIFGLPFIIRAKMAINTWEKYVVSSIFQTTFPIYYHPPELRDCVVSQVGPALALAARGKT
jgi:hypothetical protein